MTIQVVTALIEDEQGRIFLQQRPEGKEFPGYWETPGGKVELSDQNPRAALRRELREELGLDDVYIAGRPVLIVAFDPPLVRTALDLIVLRVELGASPPPRALDHQQAIAFKYLHEVTRELWVPSLRAIEAVLIITGRLAGVAPADGTLHTRSAP